MHEFVVVGSTALKWHTKNQATPKDIDVICEADSFKALIKSYGERGPIDWIKPTRAGLAAKVDYKIYDAEFVDRDNPTSRLIFDRVKASPFGTVKDIISDAIWYTPDLNTLYLLKMSHRYLKNSPHFHKTMNDIHIMRGMGATIENEELLLAREEVTYTYSHPKLNQSKDGFFSGDGLEYVYDHDSIHEAMKHLDKPAYTYYMTEGEEVLCSREKFENLPIQTRIYGVLEEAYVLALERAVIPHNTHPQEAFEIALQKICTSITSGWFREFAWENYGRVMEMFKQESPDYVEMFWRGIKNETVIKL